MKFLVVGAAVFVVDTASLSAFVLVLSMNKTLAKALSFLIAVLASFLGNHLWTFRDSRSKHVAKHLIQFACVSLGGLAINVAVFSAVQSAAPSRWGHLTVLYAGQVAAVGAAMVWNFSANRLITYRDAP